MIQNKDDLEYYLMSDKIALRIPEKRKFPRPVVDSIWKYEILLRKTEYFTNRFQNKPSLRNKFYMIIYKFRLEKMSIKLGFSIGLNAFDAGLSIAHYGSIVVNSKARIGKNCRIQEGVTIGTTNGNDAAPTIGDNCFLGSGCKVIGDIKLGDDIAVGAGAVVVKDVIENRVTLAGVPAKIVSRKGSGSNVFRKIEGDKDL